MKINIKKTLWAIVLISMVSFLLLAGVYRFRGVLRRAFFVPVSLSEMQLTDASSGERRALCKGKNACLVVYVSPWCPACKRQLPFIKEIASTVQGYPGIGLEVIMGWDRRAKLIEMAQGLGLDALLDDRGSFAAAASVSSVPSWYLFSNGSLNRALSPGRESATEFLRQTLLAESF